MRFGWSSYPVPEAPEEGVNLKKEGALSKDKESYEGVYLVRAGAGVKVGGSEGTVGVVTFDSATAFALG